MPIADTRDLSVRRRSKFGARLVPQHTRKEHAANCECTVMLYHKLDDVSLAVDRASAEPLNAGGKEARALVKAYFSAERPAFNAVPLAERTARGFLHVSPHREAAGGEGDDKDQSEHSLKDVFVVNVETRWPIKCT